MTLSCVLMVTKNEMSGSDQQKRQKKPHVRKEGASSNRLIAPKLGDVRCAG